jgi:hypothetical protein
MIREYSGHKRRKIDAWTKWTYGERGRLSAAHHRTALSGSTFFKPPLCRRSLTGQGIAETIPF